MATTNQALLKKFVKRRKPAVRATNLRPGQGENATFTYLGRKPPPKLRAGEVGPPIPGLGQVQREKVRRANEAYMHPATDGANAGGKYRDYGPRLDPRTKAPSRTTRRKRNTRKYDHGDAAKWRQPQVN